ncbi:MAG: aminotransferase class III-fold pyridoxal phosphate-dependent enzyme, partial [Deltaproteobacteria bacterium]|nr:aminotransferase class III-fold pyridoxal phosphate-dependent enzyme [Deltaproteobacteria bacterium]
RVIKEENMIENSDRMGEYFRTGLQQIDTQLIKEIRGRGLLIGVELHAEAGGARKYCEKLQSAGILCKETHDNIIRFAPPLVINKEQIEWALEHIDKVFSA